MSFSNLRYDTEEQKERLKQSIEVGNYKYKQPLNCGACYQNNPMIKMQKSGVSMDGSSKWRFYDGPVDVESELRNLNRIAVKYSSGKYTPKCSNCGYKYQGQPSDAKMVKLCDHCITGRVINNEKCGDNNLVDFPDCHFPVKNTRLDSCPPRCQEINRFEYPCLDPQANLFFPGEIHMSTRLSSKDNFKPCRKVPAINDMNPYN